ncbi:coatomer beta C-terminal region-domain-containing protein [Suillus lakei]|nr:coatomer beta C-terminal region-domain-containing protein [Suillus lakei]
MRKRTSRCTDSILCLMCFWSTRCLIRYRFCLDFATLGFLKLVERPAVFTIAPHGFQSIKATIKVSSTKTGIIFGSILWEGPALTECCDTEQHRHRHHGLHKARVL